MRSSSAGCPSPNSHFGFGLAAGLVVARVIRRAEDVLRTEREHADRAAHTDALTGLLNRRGFERAQQQWRRTAQPGEEHALLLIDLDRFKPINGRSRSRRRRRRAAAHRSPDA
jgi:predicted signal transduction protein with EAL and GGDEF domain